MKQRSCVGDRARFREELMTVSPIDSVMPLAEHASGPIEKHYTPAQIADKLGLSDTKIRRMFQDESGVVKFGEPSRRLGRKLKRRYYTLRIPESVVLRVLARMRNR